MAGVSRRTDYELLDAELLHRVDGGSLVGLDVERPSAPFGVEGLSAASGARF